MGFALSVCEELTSVDLCKPVAVIERIKKGEEGTASCRE
jgi:hypothetical protein